MLDRYVKKIVTVISCALAAAVFIIALFFSAPKITPVPQTTGELTYNDEAVEIGKDIAAVRISDLGELGKITKVNYAANEFLRPRALSDKLQIVDLTKPFEFAEKGTLVFVVMNLDPADENFKEQRDKLSAYKIGDYWQFTLSLPKIFGASNVYQKTDLVARHGEIENYDFIDFNTSYDKKTERFSSETTTQYLDLQFYTKRESLENAFNSAQIITIHYQSTGSAYSGIKDAPLIGTENEVKGINETSSDLSIAFAIVCAVVFAVLAALSVLERTKEFASAIVWTAGITLMLLSRFLLGGTTGAPLFWTALSLAASFVVLGGAVLSVGVNAGKAPLKYIAVALMGLGALFAFISPFVSFGAAAALTVVCRVITAIGAASLCAFVGLAACRKSDGRGVLQTACAAVIAVAAIASLFMPAIFPAQSDPLFWLYAVTAVATFAGVFAVFTEIKKSNVYLTENLHKEVERQVKDIKAVIQERDKLLQFVSHDMKKPLVSSQTMIDTLIEREKDKEQTKGLQIVKQNTARVIGNLAEIAAYAKFNYLSEPSQTVDVKELCAALFEFHKPDCEANGIVLKNLATKSVKTFVKRKGLESVVSNLVINAVEHSSCKTITLSVKTDKNKVVLFIADDGKGIPDDMDVFKPYVSENDTETGGVGLYICKNIVESMNGTLTYSTGQNGTAFYISLLRA